MLLFLPCLIYSISTPSLYHHSITAISIQFKLVINIADSQIQVNQLTPAQPSQQHSPAAQDLLRMGIPATLLPELLVKVIEEATKTPRDQERFWLHTYDWEATMLDENHPQNLRQYVAVNHWWQRTIQGLYSVDIQCQTTPQMEQAVDGLIHEGICSIRTLIWDHEMSAVSRPSNMARPRSSDDLPPAATQTLLLKRLLEQLDGCMMKSLVLNYVLLEPLFDVTVYSGWANVTYFCYGTDDLSECFYILTDLLCQFRNLQSLMLMNIGGYAIPSVFPPRPTYSLTTFQFESVGDGELVRWATGASRTTMDELCWLPDEEGDGWVVQPNLSDVFPGDTQLQLRRLWTYATNFRLIGQCNLDVLAWIQLYPTLRNDAETLDYYEPFQDTAELLQELSKCKTLDRLWIGFHEVSLLEGILALLLEGAWPKLNFIRISVTDDTKATGEDTPMVDADGMSRNTRIVDGLDKVCIARNIRFKLDIDQILE